MRQSVFTYFLRWMQTDQIGKLNETKLVNSEIQSTTVITKNQSGFTASYPKKYRILKLYCTKKIDTVNSVLHKPIQWYTDFWPLINVAIFDNWQLNGRSIATDLNFLT